MPTMHRSSPASSRWRTACGWKSLPKASRPKRRSSSCASNPATSCRVICSASRCRRNSLRSTRWQSCTHDLAPRQAIAMAEPLSLIPVRESDIVIGKQLRWPIYDWHGKLLLAAGSIVQTKGQLDGLIQSGFFHNIQWDQSLTQTRLAAPVMARARQPEADPAQSEEAQANREQVMEMDDTRWYAGETLYLQLIDKPTVRHTVKLIGYVKNQTVLATAPSVDGRVA